MHGPARPSLSPRQGPSRSGSIGLYLCLLSTGFYLYLLPIGLCLLPIGLYLCLLPTGLYLCLLSTGLYLCLLPIGLYLCPETLNCRLKDVEWENVLTSELSADVCAETFACILTKELDKIMKAI